MTKLASSCTKTTCPYCGVGCGVDAELKKGQVVQVKGSEDHLANLGRLCIKGSALCESITPHNRLLHPKIRGKRVDWDTALTAVAEGFLSTIAKYGPDSVAFYLSGQLLTEDYYVANKLMKGFIGSANVDTNSRLCMASAVVAYKRAFGADAVPCNYEDLEQCDLLVLVGSNAAWTHPVLFQRFSAAKALRPEMKIVVLDPRRTASCEIADLHLQIKPGSDAYIFNGLLQYLHRHGFVEQDFVNKHCNDLDKALIASAACELELVAKHAEISISELQQFYDLFANTEKTVSFYSQGVNQSTSGSDKCNAIINCHLLTGRIGRAGMGPFSITGQPNAMGGREVGGLANQLAAHMDFSAENRERVARFWNSDRLANKPGLKAVDLFDAMASGKIKAIWIMATNPAVSLPDSRHVKAALQKCDLVVVSDCAEHTDTNALATILLPATGWGEKDGTVSNSERRISRQRALCSPSGEARHDWKIICDVARSMGFADAFPYNSARDIFIEHAALSGFENSNSRAFDISALSTLSSVNYDSLPGLQWPVNKKNPTGLSRLFTDWHFYTDNGRANFVPVLAAMPSVQASLSYPFLLNTGRQRDQWHTMTRTGNVAKLLTHSDAPAVYLNPQDFSSLVSAAGELVSVRSPQGSILLPAKFDAGISSGEVFVPIHWNRQFSKNACVSNIITSRVDPFSGQPESKLEAVQIEPVAIEQWYSVISTRELDIDIFDYWHKLSIPGGFRYLLACRKSKVNSAEVNSWLECINADQSCIAFCNQANADAHHLYFENEKLTMAVFHSESLMSLPEPSWLNGLLGCELAADSWLLLAGTPLDRVATGQTICSCFEVGEESIRQAIIAGARDTIDLGKRLACGTNCGSCIPDLKRLLREVAMN